MWARLSPKQQFKKVEKDLQEFDDSEEAKKQDESLVSGCDNNSGSGKPAGDGLQA